MVNGFCWLLRPLAYSPGRLVIRCRQTGRASDAAIAGGAQLVGGSLSLMTLLETYRWCPSNSAMFQGLRATAPGPYPPGPGAVTSMSASRAGASTTATDCHRVLDVQRL